MIKIDKDKYPILIELLESGTKMDALEQQIADLKSKIAEKKNKILEISRRLEFNDESNIISKEKPTPVIYDGKCYLVLNSGNMDNPEFSVMLTSGIFDLEDIQARTKAGKV